MRIYYVCDPLMAGLKNTVSSSEQEIRGKKSENDVWNYGDNKTPKLLMVFVEFVLPRKTQNPVFLVLLGVLFLFFCPEKPLPVKWFICHTTLLTVQNATWIAWRWCFIFPCKPSMSCEALSLSVKMPFVSFQASTCIVHLCTLIFFSCFLWQYLYHTYCLKKQSQVV